MHCIREQCITGHKSHNLTLLLLSLHRLLDFCCMYLAFALHLSSVSLTPSLPVRGEAFIFTQHALVTKKLE